MSLITVAEVRNHVETDLVDAALQQLIDDAELEIDIRIGAVSAQIDEIENDEPLSALIFPTRKILSITSILEEIGDDITTLASNDFRLRQGGNAIERLSTGTNARSAWGEIMTVTYVPIDDTASRKRVTIDLLKLAVNYNALDSERIGDYSATSKKYEDERSALINRLASGSFV